jgi:O-antigen/teichoic acid export membrane protein
MLANELRAKRARLIVLATLSNSASRFVAMAANLAQVPIALHYLGTEAFGLWMTIAGAVHLMTFADLGMGLGLQNRISQAYGRDDPQEIKDLYRTGFSLLGAIGLVLLMVCLPLCWLVPWSEVFRVTSPELAAQLPVALSAVVAAFSIGLPLNAGVRLATGLQLGWVTGLGAMASSMLALLVVIIAGQLDLSFAAFIAAVVLPLMLANAGVGLAAYFLLGARFRVLRGRYRPEIINTLFRQGLLFLVPQFSASVMSAAPSVIIASLLGPAAVTPFAVCQRMANAVLQILQLPLAPLWPAYAEARSRNDWVWIENTFRRSVYYATCAGGLAGLIIVLAGQPVLLLWTGNEEALPTAMTLLGFAIWVALVGSFSAVTVFLNSFGALKGQAWGGAISTGLMLVFMPAMIANYQVSGAIFAMIASCLFFGWPLVGPELYRQWRQVRQH